MSNIVGVEQFVNTFKYFIENFNGLEKLHKLLIINYFIWDKTYPLSDI